MNKNSVLKNMVFDMQEYVKMYTPLIIVLLIASYFTGIFLNVYYPGEGFSKDIQYILIKKDFISLFIQGFLFLIVATIGFFGSNPDIGIFAFLLKDKKEIKKELFNQGKTKEKFTIGAFLLLFFLIFIIEFISLGFYFYYFKIEVPFLKFLVLVFIFSVITILFSFYINESIKRDTQDKTPLFKRVLKALLIDFSVLILFANIFTFVMQPKISEKEMQQKLLKNNIVCLIDKNFKIQCFKK